MTAKNKRNQPTAKQSGLTMFLELARQCPCKTASQKHVLLYYASRVDKYGRCHPSRETICRETQLSKDTVTVANSALKAAGILTWEKGFKNQHMAAGVSNRYQLNATAMRKSAASSTSEQSVMLERSSTTELGSSTTEFECSTTESAGSTSEQSVTKEHLEGTSWKEHSSKYVPPPSREHIEMHERASKRCAMPTRVHGTKPQPHEISVARRIVDGLEKPASIYAPHQTMQWALGILSAAGVAPANSEEGRSVEQAA
jgi:hypothetical protein